jgi:hypothetical protein
MGLITISEMSGLGSSPLDQATNRARAIDTLTTPRPRLLPSGEPTAAWFRRMEHDRFGSLPRKRGRHLTRNEWVYLRREDPNLLRDWLTTGKYSPPPYLLFPEQASTPAMAQRRQAAQHATSRPRGYSWSRLTSTGEAALLQAEEMSSRHGSVMRPSAASARTYTELEAWQARRRAAEAIKRLSSQDMRLAALTTKSAAFRRMSSRQKQNYLTKIAEAFPGSKLLARLQGAASRGISRDLTTGKNERDRDLAALRKTKAWQAGLRAKHARSSSIPGFNRIPFAIQPHPFPRGLIAGPRADRPASAVRPAGSGPPAETGPMWDVLRDLELSSPPPRPRPTFLAPPTLQQQARTAPSPPPLTPVSSLQPAYRAPAAPPAAYQPPPAPPTYASMPSHGAATWGGLYIPPPLPTPRGAYQ